MTHLHAATWIQGDEPITHQVRAITAGSLHHAHSCTQDSHEKLHEPPADACLNDFLNLVICAI